MGKYIAIILCLFCLSSQSYGQEVSTTQIEKQDSAQVIVYLDSGSRVKGYINNWIIGEYIDLRTAWAASFIIKAENIIKVQQVNNNLRNQKAPYNFNETGNYVSGKVHYITGNNGDRANGSGGFGVSLSVGKKYSRWAAVGLGIGFDKYVIDSGENLFPLFVEYTSFLQEKNHSLFFNCQAGYSFAFKSDRYAILEAKGGLMVYPSIGFRFGSIGTRCTIDLGYKFQRASFTYQDIWGGGTSEQQLTYKRLALRLGILL